MPAISQQSICIEADEDRAETRVVLRAMTVFMLRSSGIWAESFGADRVGSAILRTVASAGLAVAPYFSDDATPSWVGLDSLSVDRRPISVKSTALSLGMAYETVRGAASELIARGQLVRTDGGLSISPEVLASARLAALIEADFDNFVSVLPSVSYLPVAKTTPPERGLGAPPLEPPPPGVIVRIALAFHVRVVETFTTMFGDMLAGVVFAALIAANVGHLIDDPKESRRHGRHNQTPPDHLRRPVLVRALARSLDLPFETVRRRVATMVANGTAVHVGQLGVIIPARVLVEERFLHNNKMILKQFNRMVRDLRAIGYVLPT